MSINLQVAEYCRAACWQPINYTYRYAVQGGSDGLVAAASQRGEYTQCALSPNDLYEATGVNHLEMRGHKNMAIQFRRIFDKPGPLNLN
jgi:hypothetical protein